MDPFRMKVIMINGPDNNSWWVCAVLLLWTHLAAITGVIWTGDIICEAKDDVMQHFYYTLNYLELGWTRNM